MFLPVPHSREAVFIDYARDDPRTDFFIKNRAILSQPRDMELAEYLIDQGALADRSVPNVRFRVDRAIIEMLNGISRAMVNGVLPPEQSHLLVRLAKLCKAHWESSDRYAILSEPVPDETLETGLRLYQTIGANVMRHAKLQATKTQDNHMYALSRDQHAQLAAGKRA